MAGGVKSLEISRNGPQSSTQALWNLRGMQTVSKRDFEERIQRSGQPVRAPYMVWIWVVVFILFTLLKLSGWGYLLLNLLGVKRRVLKNMPTSYSFPPTAPSQFPRLDTAELERYTREFESLGFVRLLDFSLVSHAAKQIPNFCRLFAHTGNHCFAEVSQPFPQGKAPMPVKCSIQSCLQNDWTLAFSDRKPQAASSLLRRKRALGVCMPGSTTYELLQAFLQMRDQMCTDLGISYLKDDSLDGYIAKTQRAATDMRVSNRRSRSSPHRSQNELVSYTRSPISSSSRPTEAPRPHRTIVVAVCQEHASGRTVRSSRTSRSLRSSRLAPARSGAPWRHSRPWPWSCLSSRCSCSLHRP
jgi:hypothetical protein